MPKTSSINMEKCKNKNIYVILKLFYRGNAPCSESSARNSVVLLPALKINHALSRECHRSCLVGYTNNYWVGDS